MSLSLPFRTGWPRLSVASFLLLAASVFADAPRVLVFSKTAGWRHSSIAAGQSALKQLGAEHGFATDFTEAANDFTETNLARYRAVVFLNTTGNVLNATQQTSFERYIQAGGGFVGIHSAADTEYEWPWYAKLVGAHFSSHPNLPNVRPAVVRVTDKTSPATAFLPDAWERTDEWYNYRSFYPGLQVLASLDEETYEGGTNGSIHPIAWQHAYDGGRAFYTGGGHTDASFSEPLFREHLLGGLRYAMGDGHPLDFSQAYARSVPEENRFEKTVLADHLASPMELAVAPDGRVFFTQLGGKVSLFNPETGRIRVILELPVSRTGGTGLIGIALDPDFERNGHIYLYHSPPTEAELIIFHLSRFTMGESGLIDPRSEKILLQVPVTRRSGSHHGGSLAWDGSGNLFFSTGDSTPPHPSDGYAPLDERPGESDLDAQRSAANTDDLKGKILRITPQPDGAYTIPAGNLFPPGTPLTRPEIYVMGARNPYRIAVNPLTSALYWGEIGPDAGNDSPRGPKGYDEFNRAREPGNFGWPYFIANNQAYADWDTATSSPSQKFALDAPRNDSPNNTGLKELPPPQPAFIWYPYAGSAEFPALGEGGRSAMVGAFYTHDATEASPRAIPAYYDGALFVFDWMRNWMMAVRVDAQDNFVRLEPFMSSNGDFRRPIDLAFSKDGLMYVLEYGSVYGVDNPDARLVRIDYNAGNRAPTARARIRDEDADQREEARSFLTSDRRRHREVFREVAGPTPLTVKVSGTATDPDDDEVLSYEWLAEGRVAARTADATLTFNTPGTHSVTLRVKDRAGEMAYDEVMVIAGNARPMVTIETTPNRSFFWEDSPPTYAVRVTDADDTVDPAKIDVRLRYDAQPASGAAPLGQTLMAASDCRACHTPDQPAMGPTLLAIAQRYAGQPGIVRTLAEKIIQGGSGNWGNQYVMAAHPQIPPEEAEEMVRYILSLGHAAAASRTTPISGTLALDQHQPGEPLGRYTLTASYTDEARGDAPALSASSSVSLRQATVPAEYVDGYAGFNRWGPKLAWGKHKSHLYLRDVDLSGLAGFTFTYTAPAAGEIEVRLHSLNGPVISRIPFAAAREDASVSGTLTTPSRASGDLYFIMRQPRPPNDNVITVKTLHFDRKK